uniref:NS2 n=1 Tax=uncultured densovirus TaxID=748192 RepID=A0A7M4CBH2_9VIRU|nr:NS2 [uncultured densovirus]
MMATEEISDVESEAGSLAIEETKKEISFETLLNKILISQEPLSATEPGYLLGFVQMLEAEDHLPAEIENSLRGLTKVGKIWSCNTSKASKKGVIEYLQSCKGLTGNLFETYFASKTLESIKTFLIAYKEMEITEEDCFRYVEKIHMSTSSTTATSAMDRAGATGTKKRKHTALTDDEIVVDIDEIPVVVEPQPTFKCYSSITARKDGILHTQKLEELWKQYQMKVTIYRKADLLEASAGIGKWKLRHQEMEINFNAGDRVSQMLRKMRDDQLKYLEGKNAKWERVKESR